MRRDLRPRGVRITEHLRFGASPLTDADAVAAAARVMEEQGWAVEQPPDPTVVTGSSGAVEVRVAVDGAALQVDIRNPECLETSGDAARETDDRTGQDVEWAP